VVKKKTKKKKGPKGESKEEPPLLNHSPFPSSLEREREQHEGRTKKEKKCPPEGRPIDKLKRTARPKKVAGKKSGDTNG